jgi:hypothetical protein
MKNFKGIHPVFAGRFYKKTKTMPAENPAQKL